MEKTREPTHRTEGIGARILLGTGILILVCLTLGLLPLFIGVAG
jgi:hypothetical protein